MSLSVSTQALVPFVRLDWRSYCGQQPLETLMPGMAHRPKPVQAENVASLGTAHTQQPAQPQKHHASASNAGSSIQILYNPLLMLN